MGLWHLGTVTAACLASVGHHIVGLDFDAEVIEKLNMGQPPIFEPGLEQMVRDGLNAKSLTFTSQATAVSEAEVVWITYDTPVDDNDHADVGFVLNQVRQLFPHLRQDTLILISSQLPVGSTGSLETEYAAAFPQKPVSFAYSPENLRLGKAIDVFLHPDRIVIGTRPSLDQGRVQALLRPITDRIEWMAVESAEMTKHALNAFLALSVTFANEIAILCESVGADAKEVERGLKSEVRIGAKAYLGPGAAFAGGTLARDVQFLTQVGREHQQLLHLLNAVQVSNESHKQWARHKLTEILGDVSGKTIAMWGLTYKPGTDTLRRSSAVEMCLYLAEHGAAIQAHDPAVRILPPELADKIRLCSTPLEALDHAAALVLGTEWPDYRAVAPAEICQRMDIPVVIDPGRYLIKTLGNDDTIQYIVVGKG
jgi:UDPglucose 6-dehydrogenase